MGGRGAFSATEEMFSEDKGIRDSASLDIYTVASLNTNIAKGTTPDAAIARFREQLMDADLEYSAWIDDKGYAHSLGSSGDGKYTQVVPFQTMSHETGVSTIVHNHPADKDRRYGGTFSSGDLYYLGRSYNESNGAVKKIIATAREGTYTAVATKELKKYSSSQLKRKIKAANKKVEKATTGKTFPSKKKMWEAIQQETAKQYGKIGFNISYQPQKKQSKKLIAQKIGEIKGDKL